MFYAPHILYKKHSHELQLDEFGKPIPDYCEEWEEIGTCRCDDDTTQKLVSANGQEYHSRYHVVYDRTTAVKEGDEIQCLDKEGNVRGRGVVGMVKSTNYMTYSELWT